MTPQQSARAVVDQPASISTAAIYQICVWGCLDDHWADWFDGMTLTRDSDHNTSTLTGAVPDQPALHGILARIRDLGLPLLSLVRLAAESNRPPPRK